MISLCVEWRAIARCCWTRLWTITPLRRETTQWCDFRRRVSVAWSLSAMVQGVRGMDIDLNLGGSKSARISSKPSNFLRGYMTGRCG